MAKLRETSLRNQLARTRQLDTLRCHRPLTQAEHDEADLLTHRAYMRAWRAQQRETEARINARLRQPSGAPA